MRKYSQPSIAKGLSGNNLGGNMQYSELLLIYMGSITVIRLGQILCRSYLHGNGNLLVGKGRRIS